MLSTGSACAAAYAVNSSEISETPAIQENEHLELGWMNAPNKRSETFF